MWRKIVIPIGLVLIAVVLIIFTIKNKNEPVYNSTRSYNELLLKMDSLNNKLDSLSIKRDTLYNTIDSSKKNVTVIQNWYEEKRNHVLTQPIDSDCLFFSNYLSKNFK